MPRPLYPRGKNPGTHWIGGWVSGQFKELRKTEQEGKKTTFINYPDELVSFYFIGSVTPLCDLQNIKVLMKTVLYYILTN
jgi:hypothetical protein